MGNIAPSIHADRIPCGDRIPEGDIQETQSGQGVHLQCTCSVFAVMGVARRRQDRTMQTRKCLHGDGVPEGGRTGNAHEVPFGDEVPEGGKTRNANVVL